MKSDETCSHVVFHSSPVLSAPLQAHIKLLFPKGDTWKGMWMAFPPFYSHQNCILLYETWADKTKYPPVYVKLRTFSNHRPFPLSIKTCPHQLLQQEMKGGDHRTHYTSGSRGTHCQHFSVNNGINRSITPKVGRPVEISGVNAHCWVA